MKIFDYVKTLKKFNTFSDVISYNSTKYPKKIFIEDDKIKINYHQFNNLVDYKKQMARARNIMNKNVQIANNSLTFSIVE